MSNSLDYKAIIGITLGATVVIGGLVCLVGYLSKCQRCGKWFTKSTIKKDIVKEEQAAKDVERNDRHYDKDGKETGHTTRK